MSETKVKCWDCKNKMRVPGSAHIECAWRRGSRSHVWFYEGFNPNYPVPVFECDGWEQGELGVFLDEVNDEVKNK